MRATPPPFTAIVDRRPVGDRPEDFTPPLRPDEQVTRVAVLVAHGMGQQLRYETISAMVDVVRRGQKLATGMQSPVGAYLVPWRDDYLARAELSLRAADGRPHEVHVYEAYWAPLAAGRISTLETFNFLLSAGQRGQRRISAGRFGRYMFGRMNSLPIGHATRVSLILASVLLVLLAAMNAVVLAAATSRVFAAGSAQWMSPALLQDLTIDFGLFVVLAGLLMYGGVSVPARLRAARRADDRPGRVPRAVSAAGMTLVYSALATTLLTGLLVLVHVAAHGLGRHWMTWAGTPLGGLDTGLADRQGRWWQWALLVVIWGAVLGLSWRVRYFLREYVGDVAIYVSSNTLNRFAETRDAIQRAVGQVAHCVYSLRREPAAGAEASQAPLLYDRVVVVGHSLGSVVAYDVLNEMLRDEIYDRQATLRARDRTQALITFGSPLDKTAYIFRQQTREDIPLRETFAAAWQPLIRKYRYRPNRWINLYSKMDWISGKLTFYDASHDAGASSAAGSGIAPDHGREDDPALQASRHVLNLVDLEATTPLAAHTEYWDGVLLARTVFEEITCAGSPSSAS